MVLRCAHSRLPMSSLFFRTLSQGLQAFTPIAFALIWSTSGRREANGRQAGVIRRALFLSLLATAPAAWWFQQSADRALDQATLTTLTCACVAVAFQQLRRRPGADLAVGGATILVVVRQTMEMGSVLQVAVFQLRSLDATFVIVAALAIAAGVAWLWR